MADSIVDNISPYKQEAMADSIVDLVSKSHVVKKYNIGTVFYMLGKVESEEDTNSPNNTIYWQNRGYSQTVARSLVKKILPVAGNVQGEERYKDAVNIALKEIDRAEKSCLKLIESNHEDSVGDGYVIYDLESVRTLPHVGQGYIDSDFKNLKDMWTITKIADMSEIGEQWLYLERKIGFKSENGDGWKILPVPMHNGQEVAHNLLPKESS